MAALAPSASAAELAWILASALSRSPMPVPRQTQQLHSAVFHRRQQAVFNCTAFSDESTKSPTVIFKAPVPVACITCAALQPHKSSTANAYAQQGKSWHHNNYNCLEDTT